MLRVNIADCPDGGEDLNQITWAIPESYLGLLWDDVFQRIIVYLWFLELSDEERDERAGNNPEDPNVKRHNNSKYKIPEIIDKQLEDRDFYKQQPASKNFCVRPPMNESDGQIGREYLVQIMKLMRKHEKSEKDAFSKVFRDYLNKLIRYFEGEDHVNPIPVFFLQGQSGGYDYILSSKGIELVFPRRPDRLNSTDKKAEIDFRRDVYELYVLRKTSTTLLAVPPEFDLKDDGRISVEVANQLRTVRLNSADNNIEELMLENLLVNVTEQDEQAINSDVVPEQIKLIIPLILDLVERFLKALDNDFNCKEFDCETFRLPAEPCLLDYAKWIYCRIKECLENLLNPAEELSFGCYKQTLMRTRCWFLSGSVFRRIANEMPRLKARLWVDATNNLYDRLDRYERNDVNGCRALFREFLEISLPDSKKMFFRGLKIDKVKRVVDQVTTIERLRDPQTKEYILENLPGGIDPAGYRKNEIYIHNLGLLLPAVGEGPGIEKIYNDWRIGAAANPVFTDSGSCS